MKRLIAAAVLALGMAMLCSMRVYAAGGQRIVTLPEGGPLPARRGGHRAGDRPV